MKFLTLITSLCLAVGANSLVLSRSDKTRTPSVDTAIGILKGLKRSFVNLGAAAVDFNSDIHPIKEAGASLLATVDKDLEMFKHMENLTLFNCAHLIKHGSALERQSEILVKLFKEIKPRIEAYKHCATSSEVFRQAANGSTLIIEGMLKKVNHAARGMVKSHGAKVTDGLLELRDLFGPEQCKDE